MNDALWIAWPWTPAALAVCLAVLAFLLSQLPGRRKRTLGRVAILFALYLATLLACAVLGWAGGEPWLSRAVFLSSLLELLILINLVAAAVFDLALPSVRLQQANILSDLAVGSAYVLTGVWVMHRLGVDLTGIVATSAVVTAVVGLSLQATLGNLVGGLTLHLDDSIQAGDWIELEGKAQGQVKEIRWRHTVIETRDWDTLIVPNAALVSQRIQVLGRRDGRTVPHRMTITFNVDFRHAPGDVIRAVEDALHAAPIERVASEPAPHCLCMDLGKEGGDSYARYVVRFWLTDLLRDDATTSVVRSRVFAALRREGIPLAVPGATLFLSQDDPEHARRKSEREEAARVAALDGVDLFASMTAEEKVDLARRMRYAPFSRGEVVTQQGAIAHELYLLTRGEVEVRAEAEAGQGRVAAIVAPGFFGEMGLMTGEPRSASVLARSDVDCYRIGKDDFQAVLLRRPEMAREISALLAKRRVELLAVRENLDAEARLRRVDAERGRIQAAIERFFGLGRPARNA